ncbi:hypothetical protein D5125_09345 [Magnetovirga frankeli]|uniref:hypothetical protein n=1 Tax=Magnetovirga frankeli TaxID=947516 RepID=UPI001293F129|nr:hypothetical protein D5125_09345 [gamma proteobacterium SS-5]
MAKKLSRLFLRPYDDRIRITEKRRSKKASIIWITVAFMAIQPFIILGLGPHGIGEPIPTQELPLYAAVMAGLYLLTIGVLLLLDWLRAR